VSKDLTRLARPSGGLAMVAVDQREALRGMFSAHHPGVIGDEVLTQFKVDVARELSPAGSALLVDLEFGLRQIVEANALAPTCGLIAATDLLIGPAGGAATDTALDPSVDVVEMRDLGAVGLKFLILWRADDDPEIRDALAREFLAACERAGLPSILEIIVKAPNDSSVPFDREEQLITAAAEAAAWQPALYKAEVPYHGAGDPMLITEASKRITDAIGSPWVVLSNGVTKENFAGGVEAACKGGASGFLAGRAVWADIVGSDDIPKALREVSLPRLQALGQIVDEHARPWFSA
jgi:sulfofructosephosphate aldolase